jgi:hypothetical protein
MTRNGKIARLPRQLREQLNRRLADGEPGNRLVEWLNELPEVRAALAENFNGRKISEQNLSEWKQRGYQEWLARQETLACARELAADAKELQEASEGSLADHLATIVGARYAKTLAGWNGELNDELRRELRALRSLAQDVVELRRGDHSAARLKLEQERLAEERDWTEEELIEHFQRWVQNSRVRDCICGKHVSPEEREARMRKIFGLEPKTPKGATPDAADAGLSPPDPTGSNQIQLGV